MKIRNFLLLFVYLMIGISVLLGCSTGPGISTHILRIETFGSGKSDYDLTISYNGSRIERVTLANISGDPGSTSFIDGGFRIEFRYNGRRLSQIVKFQEKTEVSTSLYDATIKGSENTILSLANVRYMYELATDIQLLDISYDFSSNTPILHQEFRSVLNFNDNRERLWLTKSGNEFLVHAFSSSDTPALKLIPQDKFFLELLESVIRDKV